MNFEQRVRDMAENEAMRRDEDLLLGMLSACDPRPDGSGYRCRCPVHEDRNPACSVKRRGDGGWRWHCFACGQGGDVFDLVMKLDRCTFPEARARLGARQAMPVAKTRAQSPQRPNARLRSADPPRTHALLCETPGCDRTLFVSMLELAVMLDGVPSCPTWLVERQGDLIAALCPAHAKPVRDAEAALERLDRARAMVRRETLRQGNGGPGMKQPGVVRL